jgi:hypothetical protein
MSTDQESSTGGGGSKMDHRDDQESSPHSGGQKTGHSDDQEDSSWFTRSGRMRVIKAGELNDGSLGGHEVSPKGVITSDQESSPGGGGPKTGHMDDQEDSPRITRCVRIGIAGNDSEEFIRDDSLGRYEMYVVSLQVKEGLGVALIDTGSQISLAKE